VKLLRRPGFRLLVEAVAIVLAAVIAGLRLGAAGIIAAVAVVWVTVARIEYSLARPRERRRRPAPVALPFVPATEPASETVRVLPRPPFEVSPEPEPEPEPVAAEPRQWKFWDLERAVREGGEATEEQEFLLLYLRDYAGPAGLLPFDFDDLVRESFGDALEAVVG